MYCVHTHTNTFFQNNLKILAHFMAFNPEIVLPQTRTFPYMMICHRFSSPESQFWDEIQTAGGLLRSASGTTAWSRERACKALSFSLLFSFFLFLWYTFKEDFSQSHRSWSWMALQLFPEMKLGGWPLYSCVGKKYNVSPHCVKAFLERVCSYWQRCFLQQRQCQGRRESFSPEGI